MLGIQARIIPWTIANNIGADANRDRKQQKVKKIYFLGKNYSGFSSDLKTFENHSLRKSLMDVSWGKNYRSGPLTWVVWVLHTTVVSLDTRSLNEFTPLVEEKKKSKNI